MIADHMRREAAAAVPPTVNHPPHYGGESNPFECIKVLAAWLSPEQLSGFLLGNAIKYVCRAGKKGEDRTAEDLQKAIWYLTREVERVKAEGVSKDSLEKGVVQTVPVGQPGATTERGSVGGE